MPIPVRPLQSIELTNNKWHDVFPVGGQYCRGIAHRGLAVHDVTSRLCCSLRTSIILVHLVYGEYPACKPTTTS